MLFARRRHLSLGLLLAVISGAAALAHQLLWTRRLVDVLGADADTFSKVVGAFFIGLSVGAWLSSRVTSRRGFWAQVALAEFGIAALALPMVLFGRSAGSFALAPGMKLLLPMVLITPPAIAMGLVIPWLLRALAADERFRAKHAVIVYAANTLGGVLGIAFVVFEGLPRLGLNGAAWTAIAANFVVAAAACALSRFYPQPTAYGAAGSAIGAPGGRAPAPSQLSFPVNSLAFLSGFVVLALEVVLQHQLAQVTINSFFSSATVLVLVLVSLGVAAFLVPWLTRRLGDVRSLLGALFVAVVLCATQPFVLMAGRGGLHILPYELQPLPYTWEVLKLGLLAVCPMLLASGLIFPILLKSTMASSGARRVGVLFAWNGLGGWLGAELGQSWLAPHFGLWQAAVVLAALYAVVFFWICYTHDADLAPKFSAPAVLACAVLVAACAWHASTLPQATVGRNERLAAVAVGREGVVAALECGPGDWRMLFNNSYTLGGSRAQFNQERQALLPLLLHGQPEAVATLGVATGSTVAGAALHPHVRTIEAIELSPLVLHYARELFAPFNRNIFDDCRVRFTQDDARWVMARRKQSFDVVVGDLFLPWRTGEARLFTLEHFTNVRHSLRPGGLFCQWLPMFQLTQAQFEVIARTFQQVFPEAFLVRGDFYTEMPILGLVGGRSLCQIDWPSVQAQCARLRNAGVVSDPLMRHAEGVAMAVVGPLPLCAPGILNTLGNSWLEWHAGRNILGMRAPWFIGVPCAEYVRDAHRAGIEFIPEELRAAHDAGQFFLTLEVAAKVQLPVLTNLQAQIEQRMPPSLRLDAAAGWAQWPTAHPRRTLPGADACAP